MSNSKNSSSEEQQSKFIQSMLDASLSAVLLLEPVRTDGGDISDFIIKAANRAIKEHMNIEAKDAVDKPISSFVPLFKEFGFFDLFVSVAQTRQVQRKELQYKDSRIDDWYEIGLHLMKTQ